MRTNLTGCPYRSHLMDNRINRKTHTERAKSVLSLAIFTATENHTAASGSLIRQRVESCLSTALAICKEDPQEIYELIDKAREVKNNG